MDATATGSLLDVAPAEQPAEGITRKNRLSPIEFAVIVLKLRLYHWQAFILADVARGLPTVAVTPNGAGKTSVIIVVLALWCLHEFPGSTVVVTSATFRAVRTQVFAGLEQHKSKFPGWIWKDTEIEGANGGRVIGFATDSGAKFEGFHAYPDRPLLIIKDEAKSIPDSIYEGADRCQPTMSLDISSPGGHFGRFHDAFKSARFAQHRIGRGDCPHITPGYIEQMKEQYGEDSDIYRSMIEGKFARGQEGGKVVQFDEYERCLATPPPWQPGKRQAFCDFADSGDLCIVAKRDGNKIDFADEWKPEGDKEVVCLHFARVLRPLQEQGYELFGDEDGTGHGYITGLKLMGITVRGVRNNGDTTKPKIYFNLAAEHWWTFAKQIRECRVILPQHDTLKRQLCQREQNWIQDASKKKIYGREDGRLQLQPKARAGHPSPNHADAVVGVAYDYPTLESESYVNPDRTRDGQTVLPSRYAEIQELENAERIAGMDEGDF